jgi:hypothetical protein
MKRLAIGSQAMRYWFSNSREPKDWDFIQPLSKSSRNTREMQFYWVPSFQYILNNNKDDKFVEPDFLYTIKMSHAAWDINWDKTMKDILFLKGKGCKLDRTLFDMLYKEWEILHGKKKVKMDVDNKDFFKGNIKRKYDHEWLHEQFMFGDRPLNEKIREDLNSPLCSEILWNKLSKLQKLKCASEELMVLTAERYIFVDEPNKPMPLQIAKTKMLKKMITSTTSGWFNFFLIDNFEEIRTMYSEHFKQKIDIINQLNKGEE